MDKFLTQKMEEEITRIECPKTRTARPCRARACVTRSYTTTRSSSSGASPTYEISLLVKGGSPAEGKTTTLHRFG